MNRDADNAKQQLSPFKRWSFRAAAVLLGLSPFLIAEVALRFNGWQPALPVADPFIGFQSIHPLFVADNDKRMMVTAENRIGYFQPESFPIQKQANEYRIFCIGGSTVQGRPYAIETSFTTWLQLTLEAADPSRQWNVVNCGGASYASYRLVPIVEEVLGYDPDLIILYTGHNEFLEDRSYSRAKQMPAFIARIYANLSRLKSLRCVHQWLTSERFTRDVATSTQMLPTEVEALLDYRGGLETYHRDTKWRQAVVEHFEFNLRRMINVSNLAEIPIVIVDPAANLKDCPPFKSEHSADCTAEEIDQIRQLIAESMKISEANGRYAVVLLEQAIAIDPKHAEIHFRLASSYADAKQYQEARDHFRFALEEDVCPLRIIQPLNQVIQRVAETTDTRCVRVRHVFEAMSDGSIPGNNLFFDHVHPTFHGHQVIATEIAKTLTSMNIVKANAGWESRRDERFDQHWQSLDTVYFERGKQRLNALKLWTKGRSKKLR